jgi:hypothetical protein
MNLFEYLDRLTDEPTMGLDDKVLLLTESLVTSALAKTNGNKHAAARLLFINPTTLITIMWRLGLEDQIEKPKTGLKRQKDAPRRRQCNRCGDIAKRNHRCEICGSTAYKNL